MQSSSLMNPLILLLLLLLIHFAATISVTATTTALKRSPGFLYTRGSRGRCTPEFWSSRREAWPRMLPPTSTVSKVFGSRATERYRSDMTLLESTTARSDEGDAFGRLMRQASAALLNSYARKRFSYSSWEVKTLMIQALVSEEAAARVAKQFSVANDACN
ncbi:hypothetical protein SLEP1_g815 [Rubroshorea leprosula]|uniref:Uncharacterized protein n=1 Tax=Rubroshorea leprosula TaxID=152421 RepID=A0AAV5HKI0_9ROSI|nr:hypothetical protein SLEP1_g815 [Rubroshorea leprosula]